MNTPEARSVTLKFDGALIMQMQGQGPVKLVVVEVTSEGTLRATASWDGELQGAPFAELVGGGRFVITLVPGMLSVLRDLKQLGGGR